MVEVASEEYGPLTMQGVAPRLSETPGSVRWVGPSLGFHTQDVLRERLGMSVEAIEQLRADGVV